MKILNKVFGFSTACVIALSCVFTTSADENKPRSIAIFGDSIASGYGLENYSKDNNSNCESYGNLLKNFYEISDDNFSNNAIDGQTSKELYESMSSGKYDDPLKNDLIIISIGGNDLLDVIIGENSPLHENTQIDKFLSGEMTLMQALQGADLMSLAKEISTKADEKITEFSNNIPLVVNYVKEKNPDAQIILQNLYNPMKTGVEVVDNLYANTISKLNNAISQVEGVYICDIYTTFSQSDLTLVQQDFTHPNADGHKLIFETMKTTINDNCTFTQEVQTISNETSNSKISKNTLLIFSSVLLVVGVGIVAIVIKVSNKK